MRKIKVGGQIVAAVVLCLCLAACTAKEATLDERVEEARRLWGRAEYQQVIALCTEITAAYPESAEAYVLRGNGYLHKNELDQAAADFEKAIELKPDYAPAYIARGRLYELRDFQRRMALLEQRRPAKGYTDDEWPELRDDLLTIAARAIEDYDRAIELCTTALETNSADARAYVTRGIAHYEKRDYSQAIADYTKALEIRPDDEWAYATRGGAYAKQKDYERAIQDYSKAVEIDPRFADAYHARGQAYLQKGEFEQAIDDYDRAIEINPQHAGVYGSRAFAYMSIGDDAQYQRDLQKVRELAGERNKGT